MAELAEGAINRAPELLVLVYLVIKFLASTAQKDKLFTESLTQFGTPLEDFSKTLKALSTHCNETQNSALRAELETTNQLRESFDKNSEALGKNVAVMERLEGKMDSVIPWDGKTERRKTQHA